jgi:hypothetical protein
MSPIKPFENESESLAIANLTIENRMDRVAIYGQAHLTRDKKGLADARELKAVLDDVVKALESTKDLPDQLALTNKPRPAKNPFG